MSPERIVTETTESTPGRRGPGGVDPAVGVFMAVLAAALIGLLIWFFAGRDGTTDNDGGNPAPHSTSQEQDEPTQGPSTSTTP